MQNIIEKVQSLEKMALKWNIFVKVSQREQAVFSMGSTSTVCELYRKVREEWPYLSERYFRLSNGVEVISPDYNKKQLDDHRVNLHNNSNVVVTFATFGGAIIAQLCDMNITI